MNTLREHLSSISLFFEGSVPGKKALKIKVNDYQLEPFNPLTQNT